MAKLEKPKDIRGKHDSRKGSRDDSLDRSVSGATRSLRRKRDFIQDYKLEHGCTNPDCKWCGEFSPEQLHLDHIDPQTKHPRLKGVNKCGIDNLAWDDIIAEVQKCQVLCANCHAERTVREGHHK